MSAKWRRSQAWDDQFFPRWAWPAKFALRSLSSIWLAVVLLIGVACYGILASVPIGLVALAPTFVIYGASVLALIAVVALAPTWLLSRALRDQSRALRFLVSLVAVAALSALGVWLWWQFVWPRMHYDPARGTGLRLFAEFCDRYKASTLRRLPGVEMSELEFYGWWPLRLILLTFVLNMVIATVRRIEFNFKNLGVLTVHTGIITIALGSVYYHANKLEGDLLLLAGKPDAATGIPGEGPPQTRFHDNTRVALHFVLGDSTDQYVIPGLPRYNDYNVGAVTGKTAIDRVGNGAAWANPSIPNRSLDIPLARARDSWVDSAVRSALRQSGFNSGEIDTLLERGLLSNEFASYGDKTSKLSVDLVRELMRRSVGRSVEFHVVGYSYYAHLQPDYVKADLAERAPDEAPRPVWFLATVKPGETKPAADAIRLFVLPMTPRTRIQDNPQMPMEFTVGRFGGMTEERFRDLSERLPPGTEHALVIEIPGVRDAAGAPLRVVAPVAAGVTVPVGASGYSVTVNELQPRPEFPIITPGYEQSTSSVVKVTIKTPSGESYDRWVYHRFPEISQDFLPGQGQNGMPKRRAADPAIRIGYIDASRSKAIYIDQPAPDVIRAVIRDQGGEVLVLQPSPITTPIPIVKDSLSFLITERWDHSVEIDRPAPVDEDQQDKRLVGTHDEAAIAVDVRWKGATPDETGNRIIWLPFTKYMDNSQSTSRTITLPDGRRLMLAFGRLNHQLPGMRLRLKDFEMIAYDHRGAPRDYQSTIVVEPAGANFDAYEHIASLNYPLRAPFMWSETRGLIGNVLGSLAAGLSPRQFKFSQAGWDAGGWQETQRLTDMGQLKRPFAKFTILQVGNNPGIHIIALGGIFMGLGIPWAFYIKPWLVRREKHRIQAALAAGTYVKPGAASRPVVVQTAQTPQETAP